MCLFNRPEELSATRFRLKLFLAHLLWKHTLWALPVTLFINTILAQLSGTLLLTPLLRLAGVLLAFLMLNTSIVLVLIPILPHVFLIISVRVSFSISIIIG